MRKIIKNNIFGFILGAILFGSIGIVVATQLGANEVDYTPSNSNFNVSKVDEALNTLYNMANGVDVSVRKFCQLKSGTAEAIGSKYECDPGDGTKRNFYVLAVNNNNTIDLIMDRNINNGMMTWYDAMEYFRTGDGVSIKTNWTNIQNIDLPKAQAIVDAVGRTDWIAANNGATWWYLDKNGDSYGQTQVANATNPSNYAWLFNHLTGFSDGDCTQKGCTDASDATAYGYWTRDLVATTSDAWRMNWFGVFDSTPVSDTDHGVRPVITVLKSNLY